MIHTSKFKFSAILAAVLMLAGCAGEPAPSFEGNWIATFTTSPLETPGGGGAANGKGKGAPQSFEDQTLRVVTHVSMGGEAVRVQIANTFGDRPITLGSAHIALASDGSSNDGSAIQEGSDRALTFGGQPTIVIPEGEAVVSDPVALDVADQQHVAVSMYFPESTGLPTRHTTTLHNTYIASGDQTGNPTLTDAEETGTWYFLTGIDVLTQDPNAGTIVTFGDSITDGAASEAGTDHDWPTLLSVRLQEAGIPLAIANQGISGNRVLRDGAGVRALDRFERDVLEVPGAKYVIMLEGINDIGQGFREGATPENQFEREDLTAAYQQLIDRAHARGLTVYGATLTPYQDAGYYSEAGEEVRQWFNEWVRTSGAFDGVIDFDAAVQDPENPIHILPEFTRDNLHPNNDGYQSMADAVELSLFGE